MKIGNQTVNEIASEFGIHVSLVNRWTKEAIEALPHVFVTSFGAQVASQHSLILQTGHDVTWNIWIEVLADRMA